MIYLKEYGTYISDDILSHEDFYNKYIAIHKDIRTNGASKNDILRNGFYEGNNVNALPLYKGSIFANDIIAKKFKPRNGEFVWVLPKEGVINGMNGYKTKGGYKPHRYDGFFISNENDSIYNNYLKTFKNIKTYESFLQEVEIDEHGKNIVWRNNNIFIAVNDVNDATYISLWDSEAVGRKKVGFIILSSERFYKSRVYRKIDTVEIESKYRGSGYGLLLYKISLKYLRSDIDGLYSYLPDRVNKKEVPNIYKRLDSWNDGGDYEYIEHDIVMNESFVNISNLKLPGGYNHGGCNLFAVALHRVTGYPLYAVIGYYKEDDWEEVIKIDMKPVYYNEKAHIVVKLPNGNYLDADGEMDEAELLNLSHFGTHIEKIKIEPLTELEAINVFYGEDEQENIKTEDEKEINDIINVITLNTNISEVNNFNDIEILTLNSKQFTDIIYGKNSTPIDITVFDRIPYMSSKYDFDYNSESIKPYYIVLRRYNKIIGVSKIGNYPYTPDNQYSITYFSIDKDYRNKGYSNIMANELFRFAKEKDFVIRTSTYTYVGKLLLKRLFNKYSKKWGVDFIDKLENDGLIDRESDYDILDGRYIRHNENSNSDNIVIPDDLAEWCVNFIYSQPYKEYDIKKIPNALIKKTKELVNKKNKGSIYRGFGMDVKMSDIHLNEKGNRVFKYKWGASWSYSKEIANEFASWRDEEGQYGYLASVDINNIKYPLSIDIVISNLSQLQLDSLKFDKDNYSSENEIVVIEGFEISLDDIKLVVEPDIKHLILYHGSPNKFKSFNRKYLGSNMGKSPSNIKGFFFSDNKEVAQSFGKYLYKVGVYMENTYKINAHGQDYSEFKYKLNDIIDNLDSKYDSVEISNYKDSMQDTPVISTQYIILKTEDINIISSDVQK